MQGFSLQSIIPTGNLPKTRRDSLPKVRNFGIFFTWVISNPFTWYTRVRHLTLIKKKNYLVQFRSPLCNQRHKNNADLLKNKVILFYTFCSSEITYNITKVCYNTMDTDQSHSLYNHPHHTLHQAVHINITTLPDISTTWGNERNIMSSSTRY